MSRHPEFEIRAATEVLRRAVNTSDLTAVMSVWDEDGVLMPPGHGAVHGAAAIRAYFERLFSSGRFEFLFTSSHVTVEQGMAIERVEYTASAWTGSEVEPFYRKNGFVLTGRKLKLLVD